MLLPNPCYYFCHQKGKIFYITRYRFEPVIVSVAEALAFEGSHVYVVFAV